MSADEVREIFSERDNAQHFFETPSTASESSARGEVDMGKAIVFSIPLATLILRIVNIILQIAIVMILLRGYRRRQRERRRVVRAAGAINSNAHGIKMTTFEKETAV